MKQKIRCNIEIKKYFTALTDLLKLKKNFKEFIFKDKCKYFKLINYIIEFRVNRKIILKIFKIDFYSISKRHVAISTGIQTKMQQTICIKKVSEHFHRLTYWADQFDSRLDF